MDRVPTKIIFLLLFCVAVTAGAAVWPGDELAVTCPMGCENRLLDSYSSFYVEPDVLAVVLLGDVTGDWYENGVKIGSGQAIMVYMADRKEIKFVSGGRSRTIYLKAKSVQNCLPVIDEVYFTDDKNRRQMAVNQVLTVKARIYRNGCEDYIFGWETDSDTLVIENQEAVETDIYAKSLPADGRNPTIKAVVQNEAGDRRVKSITVAVINAIPPRLELSVREKTGKSQNSIAVSRSGSATSNEDARIEHFYVTLYYYGMHGWEIAANEHDYGRNANITLSASEGDGLYEVSAYIEDSYGAKSPVSRRTVRIGVPEKGIPNLYPNNATVHCGAGEECELGVHYDDNGPGAYVIDWYDKKKNKKITGCQGTECSVRFLSPGDYVAQARIHIIGESNYKYADIAIAVN